MRADRLLSILMLLQARGRMTAQKLADELEVSERTIYRDIDALSIAGIPVYAERGPGGGCALLDSYRTNLTGLNEDEVRALFMLSVPAPLAELGVSQELKAAMLKLSAALPDSRRLDQERARQRIHLDWAAWFQPDDPLPHLHTIREALWADRALRVTFSLPFDTHVERIIEPYGLVAKASAWYLVYAREGHARVIRVSRIIEAQIIDNEFVRPPDFDLAAFWEGWRAASEQNRPYYPVMARVSPALVAWLPHIFGERIRDRIAEAGPPDEAGWITLCLPFETFEAARERMLSFGRAAEVLEPLALRQSVRDFAAQIVAFYEERV